MRDLEPNPEQFQKQLVGHAPSAVMEAVSKSVEFWQLQKRQEIAYLGHIIVTLLAYPPKSIFESLKCPFALSSPAELRASGGFFAYWAKTAAFLGRNRLRLR